MSTVPSSYFEEQPQRLICSVQEVREQEGDFGPQIVVEILPLGESVNRPLFFSASNPTSSRSKWQKWLKSWKNVGVKPTSADDLVGKIVMLEEVVNQYKIDGDTVESSLWKPVKVYDSETDAIPDLDEISQGATPSVDETMSAEEDVKQLTEITDELVEQASGVYEALGRDDEKFLRVAESSYSVDPQELLDAIS